MANRFEIGAARLGRRVQQRVGVGVVYSRGASSSEPITAVPSQQEYEIFDEDGILLETVMAYEFTFAAADLVLSGSQVEPRPGDRIAATIQGAERLFQVAAQGNKPCTEWLDASGVLVLVRSNKVT